VEIDAASRILLTGGFAMVLAGNHARDVSHEFRDEGLGNTRGVLMFPLHLASAVILGGRALA
jgi:hypothetical protein